MSTYIPGNLALVSQGITGHREWHYTDTGQIGDIQEVAGYFSDGYKKGMRKGDYVRYTANAAAAGTGYRQYGLTVLTSVDTGATQTTVGLAVLIGDSS